MKNFVQPGGIVTITAPANVVAGQLVRVGLLAGVAVTDAQSGQPVNIATEGVFDVAKVGSQAWTVGAAIYGTGANTLTATTATTGNILLGVAMAAVGAGAGETIGRIKLNGSAPAALAA